MTTFVNAHRHVFLPRDEDEVDCSEGGGDDRFLGLRIGSIFIILACATCGALFPVIAKRSSCLHLPRSAYAFAKYFGSGVIIATAFIHLLDPAIEELGSPCLSTKWGEYPYALALCMLSMFCVFLVELLALRWGTARLRKLGLVQADPYGHGDGGKQKDQGDKEEARSESDLGIDIAGNSITEKVLAQIVGVAILEFGVVLHSILIGLTLAVDQNFKILFIVLIFHQSFEGLGLGSRLALMKLEPKYHWVPYVGALVYGITTPVGIAAGLGVRTTYNPGTASASIVSGVLDALSAGILLYTGLVELLAHEFLFNKEMMESSGGRLAFAVLAMFLGCGIMALLGRWA
ncbi:hypothetical protein AGABI2DRAFT_193175 [Agaricus bisporus var. bisporus H97]|uniref:hypothetical protein n=1 Tax=Agaricus bisporus var. bisporus (strain H97 / ATCC MYA-4626 / FGSC 10389) TaxID=936046 RepID=UPI00029F75BF|nr:hypothetical protein AGABI2DRAFT_193175 [Agaricus bisporus var. bisporus H97]EKV46465.1 hypothetical protein AGABI2DRAFT_193175 [Agaricus bisporus var. bisporus H97]